ncbi:flagellar biosynthetic protein FliO [Pseudomonas asplenii]|uniref:flagellar biosynthetic protein FliO n=1 Tax=Pseudomonas asplenii TaxID=53407 RepID=UPI000368AFE0|nr:flagellar biosynthetic protein FliO [Pseudomonas fuscovaginae]
MSRLLGALLCLPLSALAAEPAATAAAAPTVGGGMAGQLAQLVLGLLLVLVVIFALAWMVRRVQQAGPAGKAQVIELIGSRALGPRDRLVLVQVGKEQILLGLTPGTITPLHVLKEPVQVSNGEPAAPEFAQRLMELLGKDKK